MRASPAHATDSRGGTRRLGPHVDEHLGKRRAGTGHEPPRDVIGVTQAGRFDVDHEFLVQRMMLDDAPAPVRGVKPALQCRDGKQIVAGARSASRNAVVGARRSMPRATRHERADDGACDAEAQDEWRSKQWRDVIYLARCEVAASISDLRPPAAAAPQMWRIVERVEAPLQVVDVIPLLVSALRRREH